MKNTTHEALMLMRGIVLRRVHNDGRSPERSIWAGRDQGWIPETPENWSRWKAYKRLDNARRALGIILRHERELGIASRIGRRY